MRKYRLPTLPFELIDRIIDFLCDDQRSLYRCALTSHGWLSRSRYHLLGNMHIYSRQSFDALVRASTWTHTPSSLQAVRSLTLTESCSMHRGTSRSDHAAWVHCLPLVLGHRFPNVATLHIGWVDWGTVAVHPDTMSIGFAQFHSVTQLELHACTFRSFRQFQRLVCVFPRLHTLSVERVQLKRNGTPPDFQQLASQSTSQPKLAFVSVDARGAGDEVLGSALFEWLVMTPSIHSLRRLDFKISRGTAPHAGKLIEAVSPHLEHLRVNVDNASLPDLQHANIFQCAALRTVIIGNTANTTLDEALLMISFLSRVRMLELRLFKRETGWVNVGEILAMPHFSGLQEVVIDVQYRDSIDMAPVEGMDVVCDSLRGRGVRVVMA